jgi:hypothetical protein
LIPDSFAQNGKAIGHKPQLEKRLWDYDACPLPESVEYAETQEGDNECSQLPEAQHRIHYAGCVAS